MVALEFHLSVKVFRHLRVWVGILQSRLSGKVSIHFRVWMGILVVSVINASPHLRVGQNRSYQLRFSAI